MQIYNNNAYLLAVNLPLSKGFYEIFKKLSTVISCVLSAGYTSCLMWLSVDVVYLYKLSLTLENMSLDNEIIIS